jgi:hypothetical protein
VSAPPRPPTTTPAQSRVVEEVLGWGQPRPLVPAGLAAAVRARLDGAVAEALGGAVDRPTVRRAVPVRALVADPASGGGGPIGQDRDTLRGILLGRSFARDVELGQTGATEDVVAAVAAEVASERPGDPGSPSTWWNAAPREVREGVVAEVVGVLADLRSLWPPLSGTHLTVTVRRQLRTTAGGDALLLTARPDLVLDSPRRDDRARALVVMTRSGMPRPPEDRALVRAMAVVQTLADDRPPFRWAVLHLTDGRVETEDLDAEILLTTATALGQRAAGHLTAEAGPGGATGGLALEGRGSARGARGAR